MARSRLSIALGMIVGLALLTGSAWGEEGTADGSATLLVQGQRQ